MKLLVIDTSGPVCGVAVMEDEKVLCEYTAQNRNTHSANLMPMTEAALQAAGKTAGEMDAIAAVTGPGSFTGVRIGVATAKGLAHGAGIPCIPVDALEALSVSAGGFDGVICPIQDARAGQVYGAAFRNGERLIPDAPMKLEEYLDTVSRLGDRFLFTGDGAPVFRERIAEILGENAAFAPAYRGYLRPSAAGSIAIRRGEATDYLHLEASYLRPPNAQKNKKLLEAMRKNEEA
jgi:tRNA threonylcarbamoyladenosine biosynthesis protein TsaB